MSYRPRLKICGITNIDDARLVGSSGADYLGILVNVSFSERSLSLKQAREVASASTIPIVVLMCEPTFEEVESVVQKIEPYAVQLVCRESPKFVKELKSRLTCQVWKTIHIPAVLGEASPEEYVEARADALIIDSSDTSEGFMRFGGTGKVANWDLAATIIKQIRVPVFLAGGITQDNVYNALAKVRPYGIDLCSGVEASKGKKDRDKVRAFVDNFKRARENTPEDKKRKEMRAAVVYGENDIRIVKIPKPSPRGGEVLIKVKGSGVCATDVKILGGSGLPKKLPTILGHEVAGEIEELGEDVSGIKEGQRIVVYPIAACGECFFCINKRYSLCLKPYGLAHGADGGFAEYMLVPSQIVRLGGIIDIGDMPFDMAVMAEPVACCMSAAEQCGTKEGDTVVVVGCGPLGLLHTIISKANRARVIVADVNEGRLQKAKEVGADVILNPTKVNLLNEVHELTEIGADVVIAAIGLTKVVEESLPLVRNGGIFNIFGGTPAGETITLDPRWLHYGEIVLTGTFAASLHHFKDALLFVKNHWAKVSQVISARCDLDGIFDAVEQTKNGTALKTIIMFN